MLHKWFTAMCSNGKPFTGITIIKKAKSFQDEMQVTDRGIFSDGWLQTFKECHGIRKLHVGGEVLFTDDDAAERYSELCHNFLEWHNCCKPRFKNPMKLNFLAVYTIIVPTNAHMYIEIIDFKLSPCFDCSFFSFG